jgi:uncharacterized integral membrane protein
MLLAALAAVILFVIETQHSVAIYLYVIPRINLPAYIAYLGVFLTGALFASALLLNDYLKSLFELRRLRKQQEAKKMFTNDAPDPDIHA